MPTASKQSTIAAEKVRLHDIDRSRYYRKAVTVECSVAGKESSPYLPPKEILLKCRTPGGRSLPMCKGCSIVDDKQIIVPKERVLHFLNVSNDQIKGYFKREEGIARTCRIEFDTLSTWHVEEMVVTPPLSFGEAERELTHQYVMKRVFCVEAEVQDNHTYQMTGYPLKIPATQKAVFLALRARPVKSSLELFILRKPDAAELREHLGEPAVLEIIHEHISTNVTKIFGRSDLHHIVDLVYHSPLHFYFNGDYIRRGYLNVLVLGDTRCGKGYVAERLARYYQLGDICSGENSTFVGLVGGIKYVDGNPFLTWGRIPHNNRGLIIIDELSDLTTDSIGKMSRVRSEGIAELDKGGIHTHTEARTRIICLSNSRNGRNLDSYSHGIEAVIDLIGRAEDISRFDLVLTVSKDEVPSSIINAPLKPKLPTPYTREFCRRLIMWVWSRTAKQVMFTKKATADILREAERLGAAYSSEIPLIMANDIRIKIARLSTATAARLFRTDRSERMVVVDDECVRLAVAFISEIYSKPSCGYKEYSEERIVVYDGKEFAAIAARLPKDCIRMFMKCRRVTLKQTIDVLRRSRSEAKDVIRECVAIGALRRKHTYWEVTSEFRKYLRSLA